MYFEPYPGLGLPFPVLFLLMVFALGLDVALYRKRNSPWAVAFWIPLLLTPSLACSGLLALIAENASRYTGPGDLSGLGVIFAICLASPWIVILIGALVCFPKFSRQALASWIVGAAVGLAIWAGLYARAEHAQSTTFLVIGPDGNPVPHQTFEVKSSHFGNPTPHGFIISGSDGKFSLWLPPGESIALSAVDTSSDFVGEVQIWNQPDYGPGPRRKIDSVCSWDVPGEPGGMGSFPISFSVAQEDPVVLILKSRRSLTSPYVASQVKALLVQATDSGQCTLDLSKVVANPEALDQLGLIAEVMAKQPTLRQPLVEGLQWSGRFLDHADNATNLFYFYHGNDDLKFRPMLAQWLGLHPDEIVLTFGNKTSVFRQAVDDRARDLIATLKPYFGTVEGATTVVQGMGPEGRPAIKDYAEAYPTATERCREQMLYSLWALHPSVDDVSWFVGSGDPHLVLAGYEAARDSIKPEERALEKARVDDALAKATDPRDLFQARNLEANLNPSSGGGN